LSATFRNKITGYPFVELNSVDSTNNYAMQGAKSGVAKHGTAYFAHEQTAGKGQRNKHWLSAKGENIILSVILDGTRLSLSQQFNLNIVAALSVLDLFNKYTTNSFKIKWPNDIYWQDRKTGGILIENIIAGSVWKYAIVGFGLNINQTVFDGALKNPVSLKQITGETYNVVEMAHELCAILENKFRELLNDGFNKLAENYNQNLYKKNETVKFKKETRIFDGRIIRVDEAGRLIVHTAYEEAFEFGSVEWIIE
jgi:BirA family biotin operon repressor/biotin-[acetyl-CoA-carboxylase] ligase